jgi:hypothetical protein
VILHYQVLKKTIILTELETGLTTYAQIHKAA